ncbi:MAG: hypothetical protein ACOVOG_01070, partial [Rubrivivax sp.]
MGPVPDQGICGSCWS